MLACVLVGCSDQDFLSSGISGINEEFSKYQKYKDSNEPQTNDEPYRIDNIDIKEIEEAPVAELDEYDMTGPQNSGIPNKETLSEIGSDDAVFIEENAAVYIYTVGNPGGGTAGLTSLHLNGIRKDTEDGVFVPDNADTLKDMLGVDSLSSVKYSADEFQNMLTDLASAADKAYVESLKEDSDWCIKIEDPMYLEQYWGIEQLGQTVEEINTRSYSIGSTEKRARITGYYGEANDKNVRLRPTMVDLNTLFEYYVNDKCEFNYGVKDNRNNAKENQPYQIFTKRGLDKFPQYKDGSYAAMKSKAGFFNNVAKDIPTLNSVIFQNYPMDNGISTKEFNLRLNSFGSKTFSLKSNIKKDSFPSKVKPELAKKYDEFGKAIGTNLGATISTMYDKDESVMYHSPISGYIGAYAAGAKVFVYISYSSGNSITINATDDIFEEAKGAYSEITEVGRYNNLNEFVSEFKIPIIYICMGEKYMDESNKDNLDKVSSTTAKFIVSKFGSK